MTPTAALATDADFDAFADHLRGVEDKSDRTATTYRTYARLFVNWLTTEHPGVDLHDVEPEHIRTWMQSQEQRGVTCDARRLGVYSLRSFYNWRNRNNRQAPNPAMQVHPPRQPSLRTDTYSAAQAERILGHANQDDSVYGQFCHAILATLRYTGLRNNELVHLRTADLDLDAAQMYVRKGKGRKARTLRIPHVLVHILEAYLDEIRPQLPTSPYLFANPNSQTNGRHIGRIAPRAVHHIVHRIGVASGVPGDHYPHRWRHHYATSLIRAGVSLEHVRKLMGHARIATTVRYLHLDNDDLAHAVNATFDSGDGGR